jgi:hypothetical protein
MTHAASPQPCQLGANLARTLAHHIKRDQPDLGFCLSAEDPHQIGISHRCERMVAHRALGQELVPDEQMALIDRPPVLRKGGAMGSETRAEFVKERVGDRPDVPLVCRIERGAVLEIDPPGTRPAQPAAGVQGPRDGLAGRDGARFQRHDDCSAVRDAIAVSGNADHLDGRHSGARQCVAKIGGAGEIVGNAPKQQLRHDRPLAWVLVSRKRRRGASPHRAQARRRSLS